MPLLLKKKKSLQGKNNLIFSDVGCGRDKKPHMILLSLMKHKIKC